MDYWLGTLCGGLILLLAYPFPGKIMLLISMGLWCLVQFLNTVWI